MAPDIKDNEIAHSKPNPESPRVAPVRRFSPAPTPAGKHQCIGQSESHLSLYQSERVERVDFDDFLVFVAPEPYLSFWLLTHTDTLNLAPCAGLGAGAGGTPRSVRLHVLLFGIVVRTDPQMQYWQYQIIQCWGYLIFWAAAHAARPATPCSRTWLTWNLIKRKRLFRHGSAPEDYPTD